MAVINEIKNIGIFTTTRVSSLVVRSIQDNTVPSNDGHLFIELGMTFEVVHNLSLNELGLNALIGNKMQVFLEKYHRWYWTNSLVSLSWNKGQLYLATEGVTYEVILEKLKD